MSLQITAISKDFSTLNLYSHGVSNFYSMKLHIHSEMALIAKLLAQNLAVTHYALLFQKQTAWHCHPL